MCVCVCSAPPPTLEEIGLDEILENDCFCNGDQCTCAAFDMDWVSSSANSCEDESYGRYTKKKDLFLNSSMTYNVTNQMCYFFILCRSTAVRSFETIPESTKIESEIRVESCSGNTKVKQEKKNTKAAIDDA